MRENALNAYAKAESNSSSVDNDHDVFSESDQERELMKFAGYRTIFSFDEASHVWKVPQRGKMHQEYERLAVHAPGPIPSPDLNFEFESIVRIASSSSSPFHSLSTTRDPTVNFVPPDNMQGSRLSWILTESIAPSFGSCENVYDDGTLYSGAYIPAENQRNTFLLDADAFHLPSQ